MCSERKDKPQTLRTVMRSMAAPFFLLTELNRAPIVKRCPASHSHRGLTVTIVFPGDGSLHHTCPGFRRIPAWPSQQRIKQSPPQPTWGGSGCWDVHPPVRLFTCCRHPQPLPPAPPRAVPMPGREAGGEGAALQAVLTSRCTAVLCFLTAPGTCRCPSLDPFFFAES